MLAHHFPHYYNRRYRRWCQKTAGVTSPVTLTLVSPSQWMSLPTFRHNNIHHHEEEQEEDTSNRHVSAHHRSTPQGFVAGLGEGGQAPPALPPSLPRRSFCNDAIHPRRVKQKSPHKNPAMDRPLLHLEGPRTRRSIRCVMGFRHHQPPAASIVEQGPRKHGRKFSPHRCYRSSSTSVALPITQPQIQRKGATPPSNPIHTFPSNLPQSPPPCSREFGVIRNRCKARRRKKRKKTITEVEGNLRRI